MSKPINEPFIHQQVAENKFKVKDTRQKVDATRWYVLDDGIISIAPEDLGPTLEAGFLQLGSPFENFAFRLTHDGSLQTKGILDVSGATSGALAWTMPGPADLANDPYLIPFADGNAVTPRNQSFALRATTTGDATGLLNATGYINSTTGEVFVRWQTGAATNPPWVVLWGGATTIATATWLPIPFNTITYDPALVTQGNDFDWASTDTGDPGNNRWELTTYTEGWYYWELVTGWDQVGTDGSNDFGYAVQRLTWTSVTNIFPLADHYASADWPKNATTSDHEMLDNPFLRASGTTFLPGTKTWRMEAKQTTGINRGLNGLNLSVWFMRPDDNANWTDEFV